MADSPRPQTPAYGPSAGLPPTPTREQMLAEISKEARISVTLAIIMIIVALLFDGAQAATNLLHVVPLLGTAAALVLSLFIGFFAQCVFFLWFALLHVRGGEKMKAFAIRLLIHLATFVVEVIPIINAIPAITLGVVAIILVSRAQETLGDLKDASDEKIREFMEKHKLMSHFAAGQYAQMRQGIESVTSPLTTAAEMQSQKETGRSYTQHQDDFRQRQIDKAMQVDLSAPHPELNKPKPKPWF